VIDYALVYPLFSIFKYSFSLVGYSEFKVKKEARREKKKGKMKESLANFFTKRSSYPVYPRRPLLAFVCLSARLKP